jgi:hypothetical protein
MKPNYREEFQMSTIERSVNICVRIFVRKGGLRNGKVLRWFLVLMRNI